MNTIAPKPTRDLAAELLRSLNTATVAGVPNKPRTPITGFRIPEDLKAKAAAKAEAEGKTLTDVVVEALKRYVRR